MDFRIDITGDSFSCRGIIIDSSIKHCFDGNRNKQLFLLIDNTSKLAKQLRKTFLGNHGYYVLTDETVDNIRIDAEKEKGILLVHGGYDSFMEEFYPVIKDFINHGYSIIMYEGPGQGQARKNGLTFRYDWEIPTSAVIDFFDLKDVNLMGISWGGYLAPRAAAFDKRIKNVICYDIFYNGLDMMLNRLSKDDGNKLMTLLKAKQKLIVNKTFEGKMKESIDLNWKIKHGMYITGTKTPYDFLKSIEQHNMSGFIEKITQNILLLAGERDQYVPVERMEQIKKELVNAKSVTSRVYTEEEGGEQHCQVGNLPIVIEELYKFLDKYN